MHKATGSRKIKQELDIKVNKLRILEASRAAKSILYIWQQIFKHRDKPNKHLARILVQGRYTQSFQEITLRKDGNEARTVCDKLHMISAY